MKHHGKVQNPVSSIGDPDAVSTANRDPAPGTIESLTALLVTCSDQILQEPTQTLTLLQNAEEWCGTAADPDIAGRYCQLRSQGHAMLQQHQEAIRWAEKGISHFTESSNKRGQATVLNIISVVESNRTDYARAIQYGERALKIGQEIDCVECVGHAASIIGLDYTYLGDNEKACEYFEISLNAWKRSEDRIGHGNAWLNLGVAMSSLQRTEESLNCHRNAEQIYREIGHTRGLVLAWINISDQLNTLGRWKDAMTLAEEAVAAARGSNGDPKRLAIALEGYAKILATHQRQDESSRALAEAGRIYREIQESRGEVNVALKRADLTNTSPEERLTLLTFAADLAQRSGIRPQEAEAHEKLSVIAEENGDWEKAYRHACRQHQLNRLIVQENATQKGKILEVQFGLEKIRAQAEIERLRNVELAKAVEEGHAHRLRAEEVSRQKSELLNIAAHDLRNLTVSILTSAELANEIAREDGPGPDLSMLLESLKTSSRTLHETLSHLLDASAVESGNTKAHPVQFDLSASIRSLVHSWEKAATEKLQTLNLMSSDCAVLAFADPVHVRQIMDNLISNAVKYAPRSSSIRIELVSLPDGSAQCSVSDRGPGLTPDDLKKLYRPFQRLSATPTNSEPSVGLGLYIVKRLADLQNATVNYQPNPGGGSIFSLTLPGSSA